MILLGSIYTFPIVLTIVYVTNIIIIVVIRSKKNEKILFQTDECKRMFDYIVINSLINAIECLISSLTLMTECLGLGSLYCSIIMPDIITLNIKLYVVNYFGEVLKSCSVILMLLFSLERFRLSIGETFTMLDKLSKIKLKWICGCIFLVSILSSYCKIDEFDIKNKFFTQTEQPLMKIFMMKRILKFFHSTSTTTTMNSNMQLEAR